jgi:hypothetical protein
MTLVKTARHSTQQKIPNWSWLFIFLCVKNEMKIKPYPDYPYAT